MDLPLPPPPPHQPSTPSQQDEEAMADEAMADVTMASPPSSDDGSVAPDGPYYLDEEGRLVCLGGDDKWYLKRANGDQTQIAEPRLRPSEVVEGVRMIYWVDEDDDIFYYSEDGSKQYLLTNGDYTQPPDFYLESPPESPQPNYSNIFGDPARYVRDTIPAATGLQQTLAPDPTIPTEQDWRATDTGAFATYDQKLHGNLRSASLEGVGSSQDAAAQGGLAQHDWATDFGVFAGFSQRINEGLRDAGLGGSGGITAQGGNAQDDLTQGGLTQGGLTQDGLTQDGLTQGDLSHRGLYQGEYAQNGSAYRRATKLSFAEAAGRNVGHAGGLARQASVAQGGGSQGGDAQGGAAQESSGATAGLSRTERRAAERREKQASRRGGHTQGGSSRQGASQAGVTQDPAGGAGGLSRAELRALQSLAGRGGGTSSAAAAEITSSVSSLNRAAASRNAEETRRLEREDFLKLFGGRYA